MANKKDCRDPSSLELSEESLSNHAELILTSDSSERKSRPPSRNLNAISSQSMPVVQNNTPRYAKKSFALLCWWSFMNFEVHMKCSRKSKRVDIAIPGYTSRVGKLQGGIVVIIVGV